MIRPLSPVAAAVCGTLALLAAGCEKPQIRVYTIPKETPVPPARMTAQGSPASGSDPAEAPAAKARPELDYKLPSGWQEAGASEFSLVNFRIAGADGGAMVNITPLAGLSGRDGAIVNMWRSQVGEPELDDKAAQEALTPVEIAGEQGKLFEVSGSKEGQTQKIVTAFVHRPDGSWFYKLQGAEAVVNAQKPAFIEFLKSVKIKAGSGKAPTTAAAAPTGDASPSPAMVTPEGWQAQPAGQMQVAKFLVTKEGAKADVSVSVFPSDTGGTLANVNRWRRQLGLPETDEAGLADTVTPLGKPAIDGAPGAILADLTNENRRLLGAIVPKEGRWWFYKMLGDATVVGAEKENFVQFVNSQP